MVKHTLLFYISPSNQYICTFDIAVILWQIRCLLNIVLIRQMLKFMFNVCNQCLYETTWRCFKIPWNWWHAWVNVFLGCLMDSWWYFFFSYLSNKVNLMRAKKLRIDRIFVQFLVNYAVRKFQLLQLERCICFRFIAWDHWKGMTLKTFKMWRLWCSLTRCEADMNNILIWIVNKTDNSYTLSSNRTLTGDTNVDTPLISFCVKKYFCFTVIETLHNHGIYIIWVWLIAILILSIVLCIILYGTHAFYSK